MALRIRPATTVLVMLIISFTFQLITILTVPVTKSLSLSEYQGYKFGVLGLCSSTSCSTTGIGYSVEDIDDLKGFTLPSNARHSISKLLIVHPIGAGFTLVLIIFTVCLHWHGPANSSRFLFSVLLWTIPTFLLCLLSFLVDILLFIPRLSWVGWTVLASTVLIALSSMVVCIMRRTASSRKSSAFRRSNTLGENYYELAPLSYGYGTVGGGASDGKSSSRNSRDGPNGANDVYVGADDLTNNEDDESPDISNNLVSSPLLYDSVRGSQNPSAQSGYTRYAQAISPISQPMDAYRSTYDPYNDNIYSVPADIPDVPQPEGTPDILPENITNIPSSAPYPDDLPTFEINAPPYPTQDPIYSIPSTLPSGPSKPLGPRPMPSSQYDSQSPPTELDNMSSTNQDEAQNFDSDNLPQLSGNSELDQAVVSRAPTFRTKIEQTLNALQPETSSINSTESQGGRQISAISFDGSTTNITEKDDPTYLYKTSSPQSFTDNEVASSTYSSHIPSEIESATQGASYPSNTNLYQRDTSASISTKHQNNLLPFAGRTESEDVINEDEYQYSDPLEKRLTPAPSFTNISTFSSNFTSVSQRGINPKYMERNPHEFHNREFPVKVQPKHPQFNNLSTKTNDISDILDTSPDFTIQRGGGKSRRR